MESKPNKDKKNSKDDFFSLAAKFVGQNYAELAQENVNTAEK